MSIVMEYNCCDICGVWDARIQEYDCRTGGERNNCLACGDKKEYNLIEQDGEMTMAELNQEGFGSIRITKAKGATSIELLNEPLSESRIEELKRIFEQDDIDLKESSVMIWDKNSKELKVLMGSDIRTISPYDFDLEKYNDGVKTLNLGQCVKMILKDNILDKDEKIIFELDEDDICKLDIENLIERFYSSKNLQSLELIEKPSGDIKKFSDVISKEQLSCIRPTIKSGISEKELEEIMKDFKECIVQLEEENNN